MVNLHIDHSIPRYSQNWVTFMPDVLIDAKEGIMWKLKLKLDSDRNVTEVAELPRLVGFLQQRTVTFIFFDDF